MNRTKRLAAKIGFLLCGALLGNTTYGQPSVSVEVRVPLPSVEIRAESDFYVPLTPYGQWEVVGSYGRCWRPGHVARDWRPYCNGNWQRCDAGWYWVSDEPWAWATYHYGRWNFTDEYGWYWVPQTQWAPAWVSWHEGGGYLGWAPLYPSGVRVISPRAYVFVEERHFLEPVRPSTVVVNNTTIINKTVNITNTKVVNNTVINEGPATAVIEKSSGRKVQAVAVGELRHKEEAGVVANQKAPATAAGTPAGTPARNAVGPGEKQLVVAHAPPTVEKPVAPMPSAAKPAPQNSKPPSEKPKPTLATVQSKPAVRPEAKPAVKPAATPEGNHPTAAKESAGLKTTKQPAKQQKPPKPVDSKAQPVTAPTTPPAKPAEPPSSP